MARRIAKCELRISNRAKNLWPRWLARIADLGVAVAAGDLLCAGDVDEFHGTRLAWLEPHGRAGGDVEPLAGGGGAIELQAGIRLAEVVMAADLDRPIADVRHLDRRHRPTGVQLDLFVEDGHRARLRLGVCRRERRDV